MAYKKITEVDNTNQINEEDSLLIIQQNSIKQVPKTNIKFGSSSEPIIYFVSTNNIEPKYRSVYKSTKSGNKYIKLNEEVSTEELLNTFLESNTFICDSVEWDPTVIGTENSCKLSKISTINYVGSSDSSNCYFWIYTDCDRFDINLVQ